MPSTERPDEQTIGSLWADAGLLGYELADDTAENYDEYDAVAQDRARSRAAS